MVAVVRAGDGKECMFSRGMSLQTLFCLSVFVSGPLHLPPSPFCTPTHSHTLPPHAPAEASGAVNGVGPHGDLDRLVEGHGEGVPPPAHGRRLAAHAVGGVLEVFRDARREPHAAHHGGLGGRGGRGGRGVVVVIREGGMEERKEEGGSQREGGLRSLQHVPVQYTRKH